MTFSEEDLSFFGQVISTQEEEAHLESFRQASEIISHGNSYLLESDYDWEEKQIYTRLYRNGSLVLNQAADLSKKECLRPIKEQVQVALQIDHENLKSALELRSKIGKNPFFLNGLGLFFYTKNLWQEAGELLEKAIRHKKNYSRAYRNLSQVLVKMGLPNESINLLEKAVRLNPTFADLHNALAWVYLESGRIQDARHHLHLAIQLNPDYYEAYLNLCLSYLQSAPHQDFDQNLPVPQEAWEALQKAARLDKRTAAKIHKITSWEEVSQQYLILRDKQAARDTINIRAICVLYYIRYLGDRENLPSRTLAYFILWLESKLEQGNNFADLRNYLATFYMFLAGYMAEKARRAFQRSGNSQHCNEESAKNYRDLKGLEKALRVVNQKLTV